MWGGCGRCISPCVFVLGPSLKKQQLPRTCHSHDRDIAELFLFVGVADALILLAKGSPMAKPDAIADEEV